MVNININRLLFVACLEFVNLSNTIYFDSTKKKTTIFTTIYCKILTSTNVPPERYQEFNSRP